MRIGIMTGARATSSDVNAIGRTITIDEIVALTQRAEAAGFSNVWMANVFALDAIITMAIAGRATRRIEVGTAVTPTYPRHPTAIAQQAVTAAAASGNRFVLGIGLAHKVMIEDALGISFARPARHMKEYLEVLAPLLRGEVVHYEGEQYCVRGLSVGAAGADAVPLIVAALGERMLKLTGRLAAGTITWLAGPRTLANHIVPTLTAAAAAAGRPTPRAIAGFPIVLTHKPHEARERIGKALAVYGDLPSYRAMLDCEGVAHPQELALVGDEAALRAGLARVREAGATDFNAAIAEVDPGAFDRTFEFLASL
ncbi:MAG TPA: TIGR03564 family F420-dependent LLM class oxidoreductase [Gammaproteobacteria bacterium]|nr:TIGR03564 family F420-dependent LLM class oxidoreductase [Gammaproteobacteria bacterium]